MRIERDIDGTATAPAARFFRAAGRGRRRSWLAAVAALLTALAVPAEELAFPGAVGWAATTPGGRGGEVLRVTNLENNGPGSFRAALSHDGPRIIVFEVGGVIDLDRETLRLEQPFVTIAGQTAPSPGITLIRGGVDIATHDVVMRHIRIRPGEAGAARGTWGEDAVSTASAYNVIVDHCSLTWATDENLSASGPRFTGETPDDWRRGTSHTLTYSHNLIAEGLADSVHPKFEHSKGSLIHDNVSEILIYGNLYAHNYERNPQFKGGVYGAIVNNFIYNPGQRAVHYNLMALEWGEVPFETGKMTAVGNVMRAGDGITDRVPDARRPRRSRILRPRQRRGGPDRRAAAHVRALRHGRGTAHRGARAAGVVGGARRPACRGSRGVGAEKRWRAALGSRSARHPGARRHRGGPRPDHRQRDASRRLPASRDDPPRVQPRRLAPGNDDAEKPGSPRRQRRRPRHLSRPLFSTVGARHCGRPVRSRALSRSPAMAGSNGNCPGRHKILCESATLRDHPPTHSPIFMSNA
jgi:hypothetical protein